MAWYELVEWHAMYRINQNWGMACHVPELSDWYMVEIGGIEPPIGHCERPVIPFNYIPLLNDKYLFNFIYLSS